MSQYQTCPECHITSGQLKNHLKSLHGYSYDDTRSILLPPVSCALGCGEFKTNAELQKHLESEHNVEEAS